MPDDRKILTTPDRGFFTGIANHVKLVWRLMADRRVNPLLKLLPVGSLLYLVFPIDVPGPFDDAAVIWGSTYVFIELCPADVVAEHRQAIEHTVAGRWVDDAPPTPEEDIIDADFEDK